MLVSYPENVLKSLDREPKYAYNKGVVLYLFTMIFFTAPNGVCAGKQSSMIHGIGTDILHIDRIRPLYEKDPEDAFFQSVFTTEERRLIAGRPAPLYGYATRFAGKEAVFKALQIGSDEIRLNEIEILEDSRGIPKVILHGHAKELAARLQIGQIHLSLSYEADYAIAYAVCEKAPYDTV